MKTKILLIVLFAVYATNMYSQVTAKFTFDKETKMITYEFKNESEDQVIFRLDGMISEHSITFYDKGNKVLYVVRGTFHRGSNPRYRASTIMKPGDSFSNKYGFEDILEAAGVKGKDIDHIKIESRFSYFEVNKNNNGGKGVLTPFKHVFNWN